jgi:hypothetical protein
VENEVFAIARIQCAVPRCIPRQHECAQSARGVTQPVFPTFLPDAAADMAFVIDSVARRVHDYRQEIGIVVRVAVKKEQARLSRNRDPDLIGKLEPAGSLEFLFREKNLNVTEQLCLVFQWKTREDWEIPLQNHPPRQRDWFRAQTLATTLAKQTKDHTQR